ncbi:zinc finger and BTB domain-containing protein 49-like isoform X1 [Leptotrombidium deliense]|uniref:Zinc finger and BTB domain-containing protein 49-like isoform X1 n=1 Tax=Leptotrombidium deliense TaxID=299467 RepID=A0A443S2L7_9ACAR|nr:zinc finger and BTB domain-containing protein 49-like isoform X1 [Leptotrombidium deliense]
MCKHKAIRNFFNTERGILLKAKERLLYKFPDGSNEIANYRTASFYLNEAEKLPQPDFSKYKGLDSDAIEKILTREQFDENLRLQEYFEINFGQPSTSLNAAQSYLAIQERPSTSANTPYSYLAIEAPLENETLKSIEVTSITEVNATNSVQDFIDESCHEENHLADNNMSNDSTIDESSEMMVDGVLIKCSHTAFTEDTVDYEATLTDNKTNEETNIDNLVNLNREIEDVHGNSPVTDRSVEKVEEIDSSVTANEDVSDEEMAPVQSKIYSCDQCSKRFLHYRNLTTHKRSHEQKFECNECTAKFTNLANLSLHKKVHKLKLECSVCGRNIFNREADYKKHLKIHSGVKEKCVCGKEFSSVDALRRHRKKCLK